MSRSLPHRGTVPMDGESIYARLKQVSDMADLRPERRLYAKLDMSEAGITRRLELASQLSDLCLALADAGRLASHARSVALSVGARGAELEWVATMLVEGGEMTPERAAVLLTERRAGRA